MKRFLVLYQSPVPARVRMAGVTPEQEKEMQDDWMKWKNETGNKIEFGLPLDTGKHVEPDGEIFKSELIVTGHAFVEAGSLGKAVEMLKTHPILETGIGNSLDVFELMPMPKKAD